MIRLDLGKWFGTQILQIKLGRVHHTHMHVVKNGTEIAEPRHVSVMDSGETLFADGNK